MGSAPRKPFFLRRNANELDPDREPLKISLIGYRFRSSPRSFAIWPTDIATHGLELSCSASARSAPLGWWFKLPGIGYSPRLVWVRAPRPGPGLWRSASEAVNADRGRSGIDRVFGQHPYGAPNAICIGFLAQNAGAALDGASVHRCLLLVSALPSRRLLRFGRCPVMSGRPYSV
jgi:hypothetical protein